MNTDKTQVEEQVKEVKRSLKYLYVSHFIVVTVLLIMTVADLIKVLW